jgi:hypothetical protein
MSSIRKQKQDACGAMQSNKNLTRFAPSLTRKFHVDRAPLYMPSLARQHEY